MQHVLVALQ